jgi:hypothetical protein
MRAASHAVTATPATFTNYDLLKLVALLAMTLDHLGAYLYPDIPELRVIGRAAAPIFCFLVGWNTSYRWRGELAGAALLVSLLNFLHSTIFPLNILWVILVGRVLMQWMDQRARREPPWQIVLAAWLWLPVMALLFDYATVGLLWMLWGRQQRYEPGSKASKCYAVAAFMGAVAVMVMFIPLSPVLMAAAIGVLACAMLCLQRFRLRACALPHLPVLMVLSRHALVYYVTHLAVIIGAALVLGIAPLSLKLY